MEIADVIGGEIFWSGYSVPKVVVVVHRLASRGDKSSRPGYGDWRSMTSKRIQ